MTADTAECPSCAREFERGPSECPHCAYQFAGDITDTGRALRYRQERLAAEKAANEDEEMRAAREWAAQLPPARPKQELESADQLHPAKVIGWLALVTGLLVSGVAISMDITVDAGFNSSAYELGIAVPSEVVNIDKVAARDMVYTTGIGFFLTGVVLIAAGLILESIERVQRRITGDGVTGSQT